MPLRNFNIIIVPAYRVKAVKSFIFLKDWRWLFLGTNACMREALIKELGETHRYFYANELQDISKKNKADFLDWIAEIGECQDKSFWWATNIAYKSPITSDMFLNYCFLLLIKKWINANLKNMIIIVENPWVIRSCSDNFSNPYVYIKGYRFYFLRIFLMQYLLSYIKTFLNFLYFIKIWILNKLFILKYYRQTSKVLKNKIDVLICTWIDDRSFKNGDGHFSDPFLGKIKNYYKTKGLKAVAITLPVFSTQFLKKIYKSKEVIPSIYFAKFGDLFRSLFKVMFLKWNNDIPIINELKLRPIFDYAKIQEKEIVYYAFLHYLIILNIFKTHNISCNALLYPFENQPWDKMMIMAMRKTGTKCKIIGCHIIGIPKFYLNYFLGKNEKNALPQPDVIVSNSEYWGEVLRDAGFSSLIKIGGSFRYSSKDLTIKERYQTSAREKDNNVLVLLSTSLEYSLDLLFYLLRIHNPEKKFLLKPHPDTPKEIIKKYIGRLPSNFNFIKGSMEEWMWQVNYAIHIGTTSAIECMMHGIKVFKYLPERIDLDPLLGIGLSQEVVTDKDNLNFTSPMLEMSLKNNLIAEPFNETVWDGILK